ncbi:MAG: protease modulator HflK [Planctomycetes bacterium]|nr:protease modulator HflK [Planctomycetota bacterium]
MTTASSEKTSVFEVVLQRTLRLSIVFAAILFVVFVFSGVTFVAPGEVALVYRFGKFVSENPPGLLLTMPTPFDEVVRVDTSKVHSVPLDDLWMSPEERPLGLSADDKLFLSEVEEFRSRETLAVTEGYSLTKDLSVVHLKAVASYEITDARAFVTNFVGAENLLRKIGVSALAMAISGLSVDEVLFSERSSVALIARASAQKRLDALESGVTLVSVSIEDISPPRALLKDFDQASNAGITGETYVRDALAYRNRVVPLARAEASDMTRKAEAGKARTLARAQGEAIEFGLLDEAYKQDPIVVWNRLYFDTMSRVIANAGGRNVVSAPEGSPVRVRIILDGKD